MFVVYMAVRNVEVEAERYSFARYTSSRQRNMMMSRRVMVQGILYSAALASICISLILVVLFFMSLFKSTYEVDVVVSNLIPLQGFWNGLIYMIPIFRQILKKRCKSQQNVSGSIQGNQIMSKAFCLSKSLGIFTWI